MISKASKVSLPKGNHRNEHKFVNPDLGRKTPIPPTQTQSQSDEAVLSNIEEDETMLESPQLDAPRNSKAKNNKESHLLSLSVSGLDQANASFQMNEGNYDTFTMKDLADATLDISQSCSAKKRKTFGRNTPAKPKKGNHAASKSNNTDQLKKRVTTSNTPGKIKKKSKEAGSKLNKRVNV